MEKHYPLEPTQKLDSLASTLSVDPVVIENLLTFCDQKHRNPKIIDIYNSGNNLVIKVEVGSSVFVIKKYNLTKSDNRDRLKAEWEFLSLVGDTDRKLPIPRAYTVDKKAGLAVYEFIDGHKISSTDLTKNHIKEAMIFLKKLNSPPIRHLTRNLQKASEAEFSIIGHLDFVINKIVRLQSCTSNSCEAQRVLAKLTERFNTVKQELLRCAILEQIKPDAPLPKKDRCLSPSDFGFHNAILRNSGTVTFIDFEYAGWDDPAKLFADFFLQPSVPIPHEYKADFLNACLFHIEDKKRNLHRKRALLLEPLFSLRWCCILLNPFKLDWANSRGLLDDTDAYEALCKSRIHSVESLLLKNN